MFSVLHFDWFKGNPHSREKNATKTLSRLERVLYLLYERIVHQQPRGVNASMNHQWSRGSDS